MWRYIRNGEQVGPVDEEQIGNLIHSREITAETLVWTEGVDSWKPARETKLASIFSKVPPPPPPAGAPTTPPPLPVTGKVKQPFWRRTWVHVVLFLFLPFVQVPLMWYQKKGRMFWRVVVTILGIFSTINILTPKDHSRSYSSSSSSYSSSEPESEPVAAATPEPAANISWEEIDDIYDLKSNHTDVQKREAWKRYEGKRVQWAGVVTEISDGWTGLTLQIKMDRDTFTSDLLIKLRKDQKEKALALSKGEMIQFSGTLDDWGSLLPITLKDGTIQ